VRRTWAPASVTPILRQRTRSYKNVSTIGALIISPQRKRLGILFRLHPGRTVKQAEAIEFLQALLRHVHGPIVLLWDRLPVHRGGKVREFINTHPRLHVESFPGYAPELNPVEYAWSWLKCNPMANRTADNLQELTDQVRTASDPLPTDQRLLLSFVKATPLPFRFP